MSSFLTISQATEGLPGTAPRLFTASSNDDVAAITTAGYMSDVVTAGRVNVGDILYIRYDVDGTPGTATYIVTATSGGSLVAYP